MNPNGSPWTNGNLNRSLGGAVGWRDVVRRRFRKVESRKEGNREWERVGARPDHPSLIMMQPVALINKRLPRARSLPLVSSSLPPSLNVFSTVHSAAEDIIDLMV